MQVAFLLYGVLPMKKVVVRMTSQVEVCRDVAVEIPDDCEIEMLSGREQEGLKNAVDETPGVMMWELADDDLLIDPGHVVYIDDIFENDNWFERGVDFFRLNDDGSWTFVPAQE